MTSAYKTRQLKENGKINNDIYMTFECAIAGLLDALDEYNHSCENIMSEKAKLERAFNRIVPNTFKN